jgi:hypothetical protein
MLYIDTLSLNMAVTSLRHQIFFAMEIIVERNARLLCNVDVCEYGHNSRHSITGNYFMSFLLYRMSLKYTALLQKYCTFPLNLPRAWNIILMYCLRQGLIVSELQKSHEFDVSRLVGVLIGYSF